MDNDLKRVAVDLVGRAIDMGAEEADVCIQSGRESQVVARMKNVESVKEARSRGYGIRVFKNKQLGFCFSSDFSAVGMREAARRAVDLSAEATRDEFNGLPESKRDFVPPDLDLYDAEVETISMEWKIDACLRMERAMFDYDRRVVNSEGAGFYDGDSTTIIANSNGACHDYKSSYCYLMCRPVAGEDGRMQAGWWFSFKRYLAELDRPESVGRKAAERAVRMLGARVPSTARAPVVFDRMTGTSALESLLDAVDGDAVFKKASYLTGRLTEQVASPIVTLVDDASIKRGIASAPFDGEGLPTGRREIVSGGALESFMYDVYTARKSGRQSTGNARRDSSSLPSIGSYNFYMEAGPSSFDDIIGSVKSGLYLTGIMGSGVDPVTGDYSLGASGIWIENGELAYPVEGITVASNMIEILENIDMVGNDLEFMGPVSCPTFRVSEMIISGAG